MLDEHAWRAVSELAASQHGRFTRRQAADHGVSRRGLARQLGLGVVAPDLPGVLRVVGSPPSWRSALSAAVLSTRGVASHRAAARLHGLDGFDSAPVEITVSRGRLPRGGGVIVHRWSDPEPGKDHEELDGIASTNVAVTLAQLGAVVDQAKVEQALDSALRRDVSMRWIQATVERLHRPGPSGTFTLLRLLRDERRSGRLPDSWFERLCQRILAAAGLPAPVLQHQVALRNGGRARLDMAWPDIRLGLECHSRRYHFGPLREASDHARDLQLTAAGWEIVYMTWHHRNHPDEFIPDLAAIIETRASQLPAA